MGVEVKLAAGDANLVDVADVEMRAPDVEGEVVLEREGVLVAEGGRLGDDVADRERLEVEVLERLGVLEADTEDAT